MLGDICINLRGPRTLEASIDCVNGIGYYAFNESSNEVISWMSAAYSRGLYGLFI
jgi:hypothetical protein